MIKKNLDEDSIKDIYKKLIPYINVTPLISGSNLINSIFDTNLYFKLEFLQNSGTFKVRGAVNNILNLETDNLKNGITTVSAGNHAIATSYVVNKFNLKNKIFIYESANIFRINKCKELKANLNFTDPHNAFKEVDLASSKDGYYFLHPFDGLRTIQGTASLGYEILSQIKKNIDNIIISVGGGGLIAGVGSYIKQKLPNCKIIGVEPLGAKGMSESLERGKPIKNVKINTIADSLSAPLHMDYSFSICKNVIDEIVTITDKEMIIAMKFMFEKFKLLLEPACVAGIAALMFHLKGRFKNQNTLVLLCGSNIDIKTWNKFISLID